MAGDEGLSQDLGYASLGTSVLAAGNKMPLIGGMANAAGTAVAGLINTTLAVATFGISGTFDLGLEQLADGLATEGDILARDAAAALAGIEGKIYVTVRDTANLLTFGQLTSLGKEWEGQSLGKSTGLFGAVSRFAINLLVPEYGDFNGPEWGVPNFGKDQNLVINQGDLAAYWHDQTDHDFYWIRDWTTTTPTYQWVGPIGTAYFLYGLVPFAIRGAFQPPAADLENPAK